MAGGREEAEGHQTSGPPRALAPLGVTEKPAVVPAPRAAHKEAAAPAAAPLIQEVGSQEAAAAAASEPPPEAAVAADAVAAKAETGAATTAPPPSEKPSVATPSTSRNAMPASGPRIVRLLAESTAMQGRRPKQEDRHVKIPDLTKAAKALKMPIGHLEQPCALFAVYDGHQGHLCAEYTAKGFHMKLLKKLSAETHAGYWTDDRVCGAMREACEELDAEFLAKFRTAPDGCTLVAAFVTGLRLFVAWVGDSRALLCRESSQGGLVTVPLTEDHRPSVKSEAERVRRAGGQIVNFDGASRVAHEGYDERVREIRRAKAQGLGTIAKEPVALAVSRALGDRDFKAVTGKALLVATPSVRCIELNPSCRFIALMCDGIPDVMTNEEAVFELASARAKEEIKTAAERAAADARAACGTLVQEAYKRGSQDNLTVILALLDWAAEVGGTKRSSSGVDSAAEPAAKQRRSGVDDATGTKGLSCGRALGPGRFLFRAHAFWQEVLPEQVTTRGLETRLSLDGVRRPLARLVSGGEGAGASETSPLADDDPRLVAAAACCPSDEARGDEAEVAAALRRTASWGDPLKVRRLLASSFAPAWACVGALCEATAQGHEDVVVELLRAKASPMAADDTLGKRTALHVACAKGQERMGELLILAGADLSAKDAAGRTPGELARENEFGMMAKRLESLGGGTGGPPSAEGAKTGAADEAETTFL